MEEKSNIEEIQDYAKLTHRIVEATEEPYPVTGVRTIQKFRRLVYMPNNTDNSSTFVWFGDFYPKVGTPRAFCGAFITLPSSFTSNVNIRKKDILDKISLKKTNKLGNKKFDEEFVLTGDISEKDKKFLTQAKFHQQLSEALKIDGVIHISINEYNLDFVPSLKGRQYMAVINPQMWIIEKDFIEKSIKQIEAFKYIIRLNLS